MLALLVIGIVSVLSLSLLGLRWIYIQVAVLRGIGRELASRYFGYLSVLFGSVVTFYAVTVLLFALYYASVDETNFTGCPCNMADFVYFSLMTMATVGYGDIVPKSSEMRLVVSLEVFTSLILVAVILSLLLSVGPSYTTDLAHRIQQLLSRIRRR